MKDKKQNMKKIIIVLFSLSIGLSVTGVIGMLYFDTELSEQELQDKKELDRWMDEYPTPKILQDAIDEGEINYEDVPKPLQNILDFYSNDSPLLFENP